MFSMYQYSSDQYAVQGVYELALCLVFRSGICRGQEHQLERMLRAAAFGLAVGQADERQPFDLPSARISGVLAVSKDLAKVSGL